LVEQSPEVGDPLWHAMICLSLMIGFEEDRARLGLPAAVDRLRDAVAYNGLTLDTDELLLADVLAGDVPSVQLADATCSPRRMGLPEAPAVH
jgi:hypothetical protein